MRDRDVAGFDRRAAGYEAGAIGQLHRRVVEAAADIAVAVAPDPHHRGRIKTVVAT